MDSPNSAVYLWSFLPFSLRSPEIDAFTLDCCTIIVLHLVCVNDGVDNRQSDGLNAFRPSHHVIQGLLVFPHPPALVFKDSCQKGGSNEILMFHPSSADLNICQVNQVGDNGLKCFIYCYSPSVGDGSVLAQGLNIFALRSSVHFWFFTK